MAEYNGAAFFAKRLAFYERQSPGTTITNLQQVFVGTEVPYSDRWHYSFLAFGKYAGFKKSFFEKYVFPKNRLTNRVVMGEIIMLNAEPFPNRRGELGRIIVSKTALVDTGWMVKWYPEEEVQQIFREAGQSIPPAGPTIPPPYELPPASPPPLRERLESYFGGVTENFGLGSSLGKYLMWLTFGLVVVSGSLVCWYGLRKGR